MHAFRLLIALGVCLGLCVRTSRAAAPQQNAFGLPDGFTADVFVSLADGLELPTAFAFLPNGALLIAEKKGVVKLFANGVVHGAPVLDLRDEVNDFVDRGLVGIAVDPDFINTQHIFVLYSHDAPNQTKDADEPRNGRIVRYTMNGNVVQRNSAVVILNDFRSDTQNHSVGTLRFASDGALFASFGDGALSAVPSAFSLRAQQLDTLNGKVIRIDKQGNGVLDNPFYDAQNPRSTRSRVWAFGFRNPFRFGLQPGTNTPFVGDVGWFDRERVMRADAGKNAGWPCYEGTVARSEFKDTKECAALSRAPRAEIEYAHDGNNASVTGGAFNTGNNFPADMRGNYFFGDYSKQFIRRAILGADGRVTRTEDFAQGMGEPVDIQFGPDGALYVLNIYSKGLLRIRYAALANAISNTSVSNLPNPTAIQNPNDGDMFLPNQTVALTSNITGGNQTWRVVFYEGAHAQTLLNAVGASSAFTMPARMGDNAFVEIIHSLIQKNDTRASKVRVYAPASDGYIRSWWLVGGFPSRTLDVDAIGEKNYADARTDVRAQFIRSPNWRVDFARYITPNDHTMAYALVWIDVPDDRKGLLGLLSDDGVAVWLNDTEIWRNKVSRYVPKPGEPDDLRDLDLPAIALKRGRNKLLIKVDQNIGDWVFKARVLNTDGSLMRDALIKTAHRALP